ncbi:hypothetical protein NOR53_3208 [gamma proteobacterium NOR5-3]|nr:hypothetical protein NOR53_3208 [gamma proteobacterium NOR5-3]
MTQPQPGLRSVWIGHAAEKQVDVVTPRIGELVTADQPFTSNRWWEEVR